MRSDSHTSSRVVQPAAPFDAEQALMLDVLGQAPVMFHRAYVGITGSITAALWLSYAMGRRAQALAAMTDASSGPVWFSFSREECEDGTGLTRHQQDTARRDLRQLGIVMEQRRATTEVAINTRLLGQLLLEQSRTQWGDRLDEPGEASLGTTGAPRIESSLPPTPKSGEAYDANGAEMP